MGINVPMDIITTARAAITPPRAIFVAGVRLLCILLQQAVLDIPQLLGQVHIVGLGIVKTLHFIPQGVHLGCAVTADFFQGGQFVDQLAALENGEDVSP